MFGEEGQGDLRPPHSSRPDTVLAIDFGQPIRNSDSLNDSHLPPEFLLAR